MSDIRPYKIGDVAVIAVRFEAEDGLAKEGEDRHDFGAAGTPEILAYCIIPTTYEPA